MLTNRLKAILLVEKSLNADKFLHALQKYGCTAHVDYKAICIPDGTALDSVNLSPWGAEANDVTSIVTMWGSGPTVARLLDLHKNVTWVSTLTAGVDRLLQSPFNTYQREELVITNMRGVFAEALAEYTIFMMLMHEKGAMRFIHQQQQLIWKKQTVGRLTGKTVAIVGFGDIGGQVALKCKQGFNMKVIGLKRDPSSVDQKYRHVVDQVVGLDRLGEALAEADYVVSVLPLVNDTKHFWTYEKFSLMNPSGFFINIGRGINQKEDDLIKALQDKKLAGCYLDVTEVEPLPQSSPLWKMENVYITPHSADDTEDSMETVMASYRTNLERFVAGQPLLNQVSRAKGY